MTCVQATVRDVIRKWIGKEEAIAGVVCTSENQEKEFYAPLTLAVDGCFSKLRREVVSRPVHVGSHFVG